MAGTKKAIKRIVTDSTGQLRVILIDLETLQPVNNPDEYKVVNAAGGSTLIEEVADITEPDPQPVASTQAVPQRQPDMVGERGRGPTQDLGRFPSAPSPASAAPTRQASYSVPNAGQVSRQPLGGLTMPSAPASTPAGRSITPGAGLANLTPASQRSGFVGSMGPNRPDMPSNNIMDAVSSSVSSVYGDQATTNITSGQQNPAQKDRISRGKAAAQKQRAGGVLTKQEREDLGFSRASVNKNNRHPTGMAMDMTVSPNDPAKAASGIATEDVAMDFAAKNPTGGIGLSSPTGYMGVANSLHLDNAGIGGTWGAAGINKNFRDNISFARETGIGPTQTFGAPTPFGPDDRQNAPTATGASPKDLESAGRTKDDRVSARSPAVAGYKAPSTTGFSAMNNFSPASATNDPNDPLGRLAGVDVTQNPASLASAGYTQRSPEEQHNIGMTVAGELSPGQLRGLAAGDPTAQAEVNAMISTIENRAASKEFEKKGLAGVLTPSQYNSLDPKNMATTAQNFTKFGSAITGAVSGFYSGGVATDDDHYYNAGLVNPGWSGALANPETIGDHRFGNILGQYKPGANYGPKVDQYARDQINRETSMRGFQPDPGRFSNPGSYSAKGGLDSPSESARGKSSSSKGYSGKGGLDSPSESARSTGKSPSQSQGGRGRGGYAAGSNSKTSSSPAQSQGGRGRGGFAASSASKSSSSTKSGPR